MKPRLPAVSLALLLALALAPVPGAARVHGKLVVQSSVSVREPVRSYTIRTGAGRLAATLSFKGAPSLVLALGPHGSRKTLARVTGRSPLRLRAKVAGGRLELRVRTPGKPASFTLTVTYVSA